MMRAFYGNAAAGLQAQRRAMAHTAAGQYEEARHQLLEAARLFAMAGEIEQEKVWLIPSSELTSDSK